MKRIIILALLVVTVALNSIHAAGQTTQFTHHGNLGFPANGNYDFQLKLYDMPTVGVGTQQGITIQKINYPVINGDFTLPFLDFGVGVFTGDELFLEIGYRVTGGGAFTFLSPRERITAVYANRSLSAATADNATQLGGFPPSSYIQNTTMPQAGSFNIVGNGTASGTLSGSIVNAATQYNINGSRMVSGTTDNTFVGMGAGIANTSGFGNSFFGSSAGAMNSSGTQNTFFGLFAGQVNVSGSDNAFFGLGAGRQNTASGNSFFGSGAGFNNNTGSNNAFFGLTTGGNNLSGSTNTFFGVNTGLNNTSGSSNTFVGAFSGNGNTTSSSNSMFGSFTNLSSGISNATAIGAQALVTQSNSLVLGSINGFNGATADTKVGIGTTAPSFRLHVIDPSNGGLRVQTNSTGGQLASFGGNGDFLIDAPGVMAGRFVVKEGGNTGIGVASPAAKLHVATNGGNILIGHAGCGAGFTGIGFGTTMSGCTNYSLLGDGTNTFINRPVGGSIFFRSGNTTQMSINVGGTVSIMLLTGGGTTQLCRNPASEIATCSSSLRYKTNIAPFQAGLNLINRLQPITFSWKANGEADLGLGAEAVAEVEPLLVTHNASGAVEGVKYDRIAVVLLNAVKEQQAQIKQQAAQIQKQQQEIDGLKRLVYHQQSRRESRKAARRAVLPMPRRDSSKGQVSSGRTN